MKTGLQKHTSKFVAGLFNSLGIIACVSLTSCGDKNKGKHTENQGENLKNKLKSVAFYQNLAEDEDHLNAIAEWLNDKNYGSDYRLTEEDLQDIFKDDPSGLREVAGKLGVQLTESDAKPDDEEINKWLTKLKSLDSADFNKLDEVLQEKVIRKFIKNNIDITNDSVIEEKLADFINEVVVEKKESEITLKIEEGGKVAIIKVSDNTTTEFVFDKIENLQDFVENLKDKEITKVEGKLSFAFTGKNVKIGGHGTGFDYSTNVANFFKCFDDLIKIKGLNLNVSGLSLKVSGGQLTLSEVKMSDDYFKTVGFWTLVKDHAALFGITDESKFEIEKTGSDDEVIVKINGFESSLKWNRVVKSGDSEFADNSGWDKIFKVKGKAAEEAGKSVTVKFDGGKYYIDDDTEGIDLNSLNDLGKLVGDLKGKKVTIGGDKKFSLAFNGKNVKVCKHGTGFDITQTDFATLLGHVKSLKDVKAIEDSFKIEIAAATDDIQLNGGVVSQEFIKKQDFWDVVKTHKDGLFGGLGSGKINVSKSGTDSKKVKIGNTELDFDVLVEDNGDIHTDWNGIFEV